MSQSAPSDEPAATTTDDGPVPLRLAVLLLWIEAAALVVLAVVELVKAATGKPENPGMAVATALLVALAAYTVWRLSGALVRRVAWARGPAIVLQLMALPVAYFMVVGESGPAVKVAGVVIGLYCLTTAGLLLAPASRVAMGRR